MNRDLRARRVQWVWTVLLAVTASFNSMACGNNSASEATGGGGDNPGGAGGGGNDAGGTGGGGSPPAAFELTMPAFGEGEMVPLKYECGGIIEGPGENISPELNWTESPLAISYALVMDDVETELHPC